MLLRIHLIIVLTCAFLFITNSYAADLTIFQGLTKHVITLDELKQKFHPSIIEVDDPVYYKHKRYSGYWLSDIFDLSEIKPDLNTVWVFTALDGYRALINAKDVIKSKSKAFVAIRDLDAPNGWEKFQQGKDWITPAPFYLVWQTKPGASKDSILPWPYQLISISILTIDQAHEKLYPDDNQRSVSVKRGFKIFSENCIACHSLNLVGGTLGPELNIPRNILEYRDRKTLEEFINDPSSFRAKSKMPTFNKILPQQSIEDVLDYLTWMRKHKVLLNK